MQAKREVNDRVWLPMPHGLGVGEKHTYGGSVIYPDFDVVLSDGEVAKYHSFVLRCLSPLVAALVDEGTMEVQAKQFAPELVVTALRIALKPPSRNCPEPFDYDAYCALADVYRFFRMSMPRNVRVKGVTAAFVGDINSTGRKRRRPFKTVHIDIKYAPRNGTSSTRSHRWSVDFNRREPKPWEMPRDDVEAICADMGLDPSRIQSIRFGFKADSDYPELLWPAVWVNGDYTDVLWVTHEPGYDWGQAFAKIVCECLDMPFADPCPHGCC
ncbi:hypothetical protein [Medusavirus stheno T3]|uniref:Uncharacterized protein n=1 Tax=Medusavirus stheno T3 TaxID=3069717 RepID=A0A7S8BEV1_9VIRU|nr:hypothetical protein QKU73_gp232 [Acanthamoeba castellanii medusavirus]QPB44543.1 hypothetical protein [Medusavirus stheno T3]